VKERASARATEKLPPPRRGRPGGGAPGAARPGPGGPGAAARLGARGGGAAKIMGRPSERRAAQRGAGAGRWARIWAPCQQPSPR
jgi:hypothetical protein